MECGDYGGTVAFTRTGSGKSVAGVICLTGPDGPVNGVVVGGTDKEGGNVYVRGIARDICEGCCPVHNVARASQPGEPCKPDEPDAPTCVYLCP